MSLEDLVVKAESFAADLQEKIAGIVADVKTEVERAQSTGAESAPSEPAAGDAAPPPASEPERAVGQQEPAPPAVVGEPTEEPEPTEPVEPAEAPAEAPAETTPPDTSGL